MSGSFCIPRDLVVARTGEAPWASLSPSSKAILPAIYRFRNMKTGLSFPSEDRLSILCGISQKAVSDGVSCLHGIIKITSERFKKIRRMNVYHLPAGKMRRGNSIWFHNAMFDNGSWASLPLSAKNVYVSMRSCSEYGHGNWEGDDCPDESMAKDAFAKREYEVFESDKGHQGLMELTGIEDARTLSSAIKDLESFQMIESLSDSIEMQWKINF